PQGGVGQTVELHQRSDMLTVAAGGGKKRFSFFYLVGEERRVFRFSLLVGLREYRRMSRRELHPGNTILPRGPALQQFRGPYFDRFRGGARPFRPRNPT